MPTTTAEVSLSAESNLYLGEVEPGESYTFPPPERKVITQSYDLSIQTLLEQWESRILELSETQRDYVWDDARASRLIESLLLNIPIPVVYFAETEDAKWEIIDGHQRIRSVVRYVRNEFPLGSLMILGELKGLRLHQLPSREQRYLLTRTMRAVVLSPDSHPNIKFEVFERLNTGSLALNAQELRNSLYRGSFNRLLRDLVKDPDFRNIMGTKTPRHRMVDEELVLRFFALRDGLNTYQPSLKIFLNAYMKKVQDADDDTLDRLQAVFQETIGRIRAILGQGAFRLTDRTGDATERAVNRALFDAHMLAFSWVTNRDLTPYREQALASLASLYQDQEFLDSIQRATGNRARTITRVRGITAALREAGLDLSIPYQLKAERE
jgi:hypothetical protein